MSRVFFLFAFLGAAFLGFWVEKGGQAPSKEPLVRVHPEKKFPVVERKSFAIVIYACNQELWCERALRSLFEQDYDHYRVIFVDDASMDGTYERAKDFIVDSAQDQKVILTRNETRLGPTASLYRALDHCLDREIVIPLDAKDWLSQSDVLNRLNAAYQNPDVWLTFGQAIRYPSYERVGPESAESLCSFYAAIFKQIQLQDLFKGDRREAAKGAYLPHLIHLAGGRVLKIDEPLSFFNFASSYTEGGSSQEPSPYQPLAEFPRARSGQEKADILLFSYNRPLQLYACLESIQRYMTGFENLTVLYRSDNESFAEGYERVKEAFPFASFVMQSAEAKKDFKPNVLKLLFDSPSEYILFGVDDLVVKDFVDLKLCMDQMEKTGAYGFYLRFGRHINHCYQSGTAQEVPSSLPLAAGVYAWDLKKAQFDWHFANSLDMTLFRKDRLKTAFEKIKFQTPNSLEFNWTSQFSPEKGIGLYFEHSKMVNIPMNIVGKTGNPHMNFLTPEELLAKFNEGLKIDIDPFYKIENESPHMDYIPDFVIR